MGTAELAAAIKAELIARCGAADIPVLQDFATALSEGIYPNVPTSSGGGGNITLVAGAESTSNTVWTTVGQASSEPSALGGGAFRYSVLLETSTGRTCYSRLYNLSDGVAVDGSALYSVSVVPELRYADITAGTTTGVPASRKTYLVQIRMDGGTPPDRVACRWAAVEKS